MFVQYRVDCHYCLQRFRLLSLFYCNLKKFCHWKYSKKSEKVAYEWCNQTHYGLRHTVYILCRFVIHLNSLQFIIFVFLNHCCYAVYGRSALGCIITNLLIIAGLLCLHTSKYELLSYYHSSLFLEENLIMKVMDDISCRPTRWATTVSNVW